MDSGFQYIDILVLLFIVVMLAMRLKSVLGTKPEGDVVIEDKKVVELFQKISKEVDKIQKEDIIEKKPAKISSKDSNDKDKVLDYLEAKLPSFTKNLFINNAKTAFEVIVKSFANGDIKTLKTLLEPKIYKGFSDNIKTRQEDGLTTISDFIGFEEVEIVEANIDKKNNLASITVKFVTEQVNLIKNKDDEYVEGDPNYIQTITDIWTFTKSINNPNPVWLLGKTKRA